MQTTTLLWCTNFTPIHINDTFWKALYETLLSWRDFLHKTLLSPLTNIKQTKLTNTYKRYTLLSTTLFTPSKSNSKKLYNKQCLIF